MNERMSERLKNLEAKTARLDIWVDELMKWKDETEEELAGLIKDRNILQARRGFLADHEKAARAVREKREKDKTKYLFDGQVFGKRALVLEVIKRYAAEHENMSSAQLLEIFPPTLQLQYGVIQPLEKVRQERKTARFQTGDEDILHLTDGEFAVCSEWNINNMGPVLRIFREELGCRIDEYVNGQEKGGKL